MHGRQQAHHTNAETDAVSGRGMTIGNGENEVDDAQEGPIDTAPESIELLLGHSCSLVLSFRCCHSQ